MPEVSRFLGIVIILAWAELREGQLLDNWERVVKEAPLLRIEGLI